MTESHSESTTTDRYLSNVSLDPPQGPPRFDDPHFWWTRYSRELENSGLTPDARSIIEADCEYIVQSCVLAHGHAGDARWPDGRVRTGLVIGAVQSGKTASMLGVIAKALDAGVDHIVVLAGTRNSLHHQTLRRLVSQLGLEDSRWNEIPPDKLPIIRPDVSRIDVSNSDPPSKKYSIGTSQYRGARRQGRPTLMVVMKHPQNLRYLRKMFREDFVPVLERGESPGHLLVLDDEADDGSILDAAAEAGLHPDAVARKETPRAIVDLWAERHRFDVTRSRNLYCTYLAYTATPQANLLQSDHNPLAPKDFVVALRTAFDEGQLDPRSLTYREPKGLSAYYTGGETFYRRLASSPSICQDTSTKPPGDIARGVRDFLVAGAIKLWSDPQRLRPSASRDARFQSSAEAKQLTPAPHCMLIHPAAETDDHFAVADRLLTSAFEADETTSQSFAASTECLPRDLVAQAIRRDEAAWITCLEDYNARAKRVQAEFSLTQTPLCPSTADWEEIKGLIIDEVAGHTRVSVVNSDERADNHPSFDPVLDNDGWRARDPLFTIFISGNVMSRGLTLEGLTTTVFTRPGSTRVADTRMQMQRWFGYRGSHLHLTKVYLDPAQRADFLAYHDDDTYLREQILHEMNSGAARSGTAPDPTVLQGLDRLATAKIQNVNTVPLCVGSYPWIPLTNAQSPEAADPNLQVLNKCFSSAPHEELIVHGKTEGRILAKPLSLLEAADLLDQLRYHGYHPDPEAWDGRRWKQLGKVVFPEHEPVEAAFYRPPHLQPDDLRTSPRSICPYSIAAYFRLWEALSTRHTAGLVDTASRQTRWNQVDLSRKVRNKPLFYVGIRYGSDDTPFSEQGLDGLRGIRMMVPRGATPFKGGWGSQPRGGVSSLVGSTTFYGDKWFDYHYRNETPKHDSKMPDWRPEGADGLILFGVARTEQKPVVGLGLAIPLGGPDQFAARHGGPGD